MILKFVFKLGCFMKNYSEDDTRVKFIDTKLYESSYKRKY